MKLLRLWLKSFIPRDIDGWELVPTGIYKGQTMFPTPGPINAWFLTDQRGFTPDISGHARMHSEIEIDLDTATMIKQEHRCHPTIQVHHDTGEEECNATASTDHMEFTDFTVEPISQQITVHLDGSSKNACLKLGPVKLAPNLDYKLDLTLQPNYKDHTLTLSVAGKIETYPAFEMYISIDQQEPITVFRAAVEPNATPLSLVGAPARHIEASLSINL